MRVEVDAQRVEERAVRAACPSASGRRRAPRSSRGRAGDAPQALGAVVDGVHRRHDGEQHLRGADVARRRSRRMCCSRVCSASGSAACRWASRDADDAARQQRLNSSRGRQERRVRAAVAHRHAEALASRSRCRRRARPGGVSSVSASRSVRPRPPARRRRGAGDQRAVVVDRAVGGRVLQQHAEDVGGGERGGHAARSPTRTSMPSGSARVAPPRSSAGGSSRSTTNALRLRSWAVTHMSSPRRRRCPRRAATRWRSAAR
jgi:hypothetical protein